jgi:hypothetical protein
MLKSWTTQRVFPLKHSSRRFFYIKKGGKNKSISGFSKKYLVYLFPDPDEPE